MWQTLNFKDRQNSFLVIKRNHQKDKLQQKKCCDQEKPAICLCFFLCLYARVCVFLYLQICVSFVSLCVSYVCVCAFVFVYVSSVCLYIPCVLWLSVAISESLYLIFVSVFVRISLCLLGALISGSVCPSVCLFLSVLQKLQKKLQNTTNLYKTLYTFTKH